MAGTLDGMEIKKRNWTPDVVAPWIRATVETFGEDRCLFGSNLPIEKLMCPLPRQVSIIASALSHLGPAALHKIFVANALRVYAIRVPG